MPHGNSKPKTKIICKICSKVFYVPPCRSNTARFCSYSCRAKWQSKYLSGNKSHSWKGGKVKKICLNCGAEYFVPKSQGIISKFCSRSCTSSYINRGSRSHLWKGGKKAINCQYCGKKFLIYPNNDRHKFCSKKCHGKWMSVHTSVSRSHLWKGGISFEPYPPTFNEAFKRMIRERDNYTCAICGKCGKSVHHINYMKKDINPGNCITLCHSCHSKTNQNREYWRAYLTKPIIPAPLQLRLPLYLRPDDI